MKTTKHIFAFFTFLFVFLVIFSPETFALYLDSPSLGYAIDLPDDFRMTDSNGFDSYQFSSELLPVEILLCTYQPGKAKNCEKIVNELVYNLNGACDSETFTWRNRDCAVAQAALVLGSQNYLGWAAAAELPYQKGYVAMLGFYPENDRQADICENHIISAIDSLCTDLGAKYQCGIFTSFAYPALGDEEIEVTIAENKISAMIDKNDAEASEYLIQREFDILVLENNNGFGQAACQRFYKMVFRDSYKRLRRFSFAVQNALTFGENPVKSQRELVQTLLTWTQNFEYVRDNNNSDFTPLVKLINGNGGDCDSRAILLAVMLRQMNLDTAFFVSSKYSHALLGVQIEGSGAKIKADGKLYTLGETTAKVDLGLVAQEMNDYTAWMPVTFYK